jgi:hypothetical protein
MIGSISFGIALVAGKNLVPNPAAGMIAFRTFFMDCSPPFFTMSPAQFQLCWIKKQDLQHSGSEDCTSWLSINKREI